MADGGQRLLDVIDDPRALESFLGSISEDLLQSAGVNNVVEQLTNSLGVEYGIDSPNDTLFDTLESSANLTDISQSNVPFDFGDHHGLDSYSVNSMGQTTSSTISTSSISGTNNASHFDLNDSTGGQPQLQISQQQCNATSSICDSNSNSLSSSFNILSSNQTLSISNNTIPFNNSSTNIISSNSNTSSVPPSVSYSTESFASQQVYQQQSTESSASVAPSDHQSRLVQHNLQQMQASSLSGSVVIQQQSLTTSPGNANLTTATTITNSANSQQQSRVDFQNLKQGGSDVLSGASSIVNEGSNLMMPPSLSGSQSSPTMQAQQTITAAQLAQLVQAQQQAVLGSQIITNANGGLQLQQAAQQSFMIDSSGQLVATPSGTTSFGGNLALVATAGGVQPTYAVLAQPTAQHLFSTNAITVQPSTSIQTIKNPNGSTTYFQTPQIIQGSNNTIVSSASNAQLPTARPKAPPQLLPKPSVASSKTTNTSATVTSSGSNNNITSTPSSVAPSTSGVGTTRNGNSSSVAMSTSNTNISTIASSVATSTPNTATTMTIDGLGQILQHVSQQSVTTSGLSFTQPSFAIGANGSAVMVSGVNNLNTMATTPQAIVLNQFGQQMILPAAVGQGGIQFIFRQQPTQPQVLTIQPTSIGAQTAAKPVVRFVSQVPQVAQTQGTVQLQQIQTPSGPQWVTVRTTPTQIQTQPQQVPSSVPIVAQIAEPRKSSPGVIPQHQQHHQLQSVNQQQQTFAQQQQTSETPTNAESSEPPKKKAKQSKKKVTIDLNDLFKKAGIDSGDFEDDGFDFFGPEDSSVVTPNAPNQNGVNTQQQQTSSYSTTNKVNGAISSNPPTIPLLHSLPHVRVLEPVQKTKQKKQATPKPKAKDKKQTEVETPVPAPSPTKPSTVVDFPIKGAPYIDLSKPAYDYVGKTTKNKKKASDQVTPLPDAPEQPTKKKKYYPKKKNDQPLATPNTTVPTTSAPLNPLPPPPQIPLFSPTPATSKPVTVPSTSTPIASAQNTPTPSNTPATVQTISLTPQNQKLLRNIQVQINRLVSMPTRNENEETAFQKLRILQQQVIATGIAVTVPSQVQTLSAAQGPASVVTPGLTTLNSSASCATITTTTGSSTTVSNTPSSSTAPISSSTATSAVQPIYVNNAKPNIVVSQSQPPPLILNNNNVIKAMTPATCATPHNTTPILVSTANTIHNSGQPPLADNSNKLNRQVFALTTNPTTKQAILIPVTNNIGASPAATILTNDSYTSTSESTSVPNDKVTSSTGKTPTTTTISTANGGIQFSQYQLRPGGIIRPAIIDKKKEDEIRLFKLQQEKEAKRKWRRDQFEKRLKEDQRLYLKPDTETPFTSMREMVERLSRFHVVREKTEMTFKEFDEDFGETSCHFIDKFNGMLAKYKGLLLRESMREVPCSEYVMLERIFVGEERASLEHDRNLVAEGEILDLPPPPPSWIPQIQEYVETELKEMERDSIVNQQVQSAVDSIMKFGNNDSTNYSLPDDNDKVEVDAFGVPISSSGYNNAINSASSADIDEAVRSILI